MENGHTAPLDGHTAFSLSPAAVAKKIPRYKKNVSYDANEHSKHERRKKSKSKGNAGAAAAAAAA